MNAGTKATAHVSVEARRGKAVTLRRGQTVRVINTFGQQVVDTGFDFVVVGP